MLLWFFNQLINDLQAQSLLLTNQRHLSLMHFSTRCNSCQCVSYMRTKVTFLFSDFILNVNRVCFPFLLHAWKIFHKWCLNKFCSVFYFHFLFIFLLVVNIASSLVAGSVSQERQFVFDLLFNIHVPIHWQIVNWYIKCDGRTIFTLSIWVLQI